MPLTFSNGFEQDLTRYYSTEMARPATSGGLAVNSCSGLVRTEQGLEMRRRLALAFFLRVDVELHRGRRIGVAEPRLHQLDVLAVVEERQSTILS